MNATAPDTDPDLTDADLAVLESLWGGAAFDFDPLLHPHGEHGRWASKAVDPTDEPGYPGNTPRSQHRFAKWSAAIRDNFDPERFLRQKAIEDLYRDGKFKPEEVTWLAGKFGLDVKKSDTELRDDLYGMLDAGAKHPGEGEDYEHVSQKVADSKSGTSALPIDAVDYAEKLATKTPEGVEYAAKSLGVHKPGATRDENAAAIMAVVRKASYEHGRTERAQAQIDVIKSAMTSGKKISDFKARIALSKELKEYDYKTLRYVQRELGLISPDEAMPKVWGIEPARQSIMEAASPPIVERIAADTRSHEIVAELSAMHTAVETARKVNGDRLQALSVELGNYWRDRANTPLEQRGQFDTDRQEWYEKSNIEAEQLMKSCATDLNSERAALVKMMKPDKPAQVKFRNVGGSADHKAAMQEAVDFFNSVTGYVGVGAPTFATISLRKTTTRARARKEFSPDGECGVGSVWLSSRSPLTAIHEVGHQVEFHNPGVAEAALDFLNHRTKGEALVSLSQKFPDYGYEGDERGREDDFGKVFGAGTAKAIYCGKHYDDGATEIISMGAETLFHRPAEFCKQDPEFAAFIIGILRGTIR